MRRPSRSLKPLVPLACVPLAALLWAGSASYANAAARVSALKVRSAIGQPLRASVTITGVPDARIDGSLRLRLLDGEAHAQEAARTTVQSTRRVGRGGVTITFTSTEPIFEPLVVLDIDVPSRAGHQRLEVPLLLDPPGTRVTAREDADAAPPRARGPVAADRVAKADRAAKAEPAVDAAARAGSEAVDEQRMRDRIAKVMQRIDELEAQSRARSTRAVAAVAAPASNALTDSARTAAASLASTAASTMPVASSTFAWGERPASVGAASAVDRAATRSALASSPMPAPAQAKPPIRLHDTPSEAQDRWLGVSPMGLLASLVGCVAGGLALLAGRRRVLRGDAGRSSFLPGATRGQSTTHGSRTSRVASEMLSGFSLSRLDQPGVDPINEADVYLAYARDDQAEEILKDALAADPGRIELYVKMLEVHARRRDVRAFELCAQQIAEHADGAEHWPSVAKLGRAIDPHNALYASDAPGTDDAVGQAAAALRRAAALTRPAELEAAG